MIQIYIYFSYYSNINMITSLVIIISGCIVDENTLFHVVIVKYSFRKFHKEEKPEI
jgi:hypothetical protein